MLSVCRNAARLLAHLSLTGSRAQCGAEYIWPTPYLVKLRGNSSLVQSSMLLRFPTFTDPLYHAEKEVEFDASQIATVEEREVALFLRGHHWVTYVTLKSGAELALKGRVAAQINALTH